MIGIDEVESEENILPQSYLETKLLRVPSGIRARLLDTFQKHRIVSEEQLKLTIACLKDERKESKMEEYEICQDDAIVLVNALECK